MSGGYHIVVCGSIVPDPLQTLEPVGGPERPSLRNEMMLPSVLDPWAAHALYEAASLAKRFPDSKLWWIALGPKAKLNTPCARVPDQMRSAVHSGPTQSAPVC